MVDASLEQVFNFNLSNEGQTLEEQDLTKLREERKRELVTGTKTFTEERGNAAGYSYDGGDTVTFFRRPKDAPAESKRMDTKQVKLENIPDAIYGLMSKK